MTETEAATVGPEWGIPGVIPTDAPAWWGARAIATAEGFDLLVDRQDCGGSGPVKAALLDWLNRAGGKQLQAFSLNCDGDRREWADSSKTVSAVVRRPGGYVYLSVWVRPDDLGLAEAKWTNERVVPEVGTTVNVQMNSIGEGIVLRRAVLTGYVALAVLPAKPPTYLKENHKSEAPICYAFGGEVVLPESFEEQHGEPICNHTVALDDDGRVIVQVEDHGIYVRVAAVNGVPAAMTLAEYIVLNSEGSSEEVAWARKAEVGASCRFDGFVGHYWNMTILGRGIPMPWGTAEARNGRACDTLSIRTRATVEVYIVAFMSEQMGDRAVLLNRQYGGILVVPGDVGRALVKSAVVTNTEKDYSLSHEVCGVKAGTSFQAAHWLAAKGSDDAKRAARAAALDLLDPADLADGGGL